MIWKTISYNPRYSISDIGLIKNNHTNRILKPGINSNGYLNIRLFQDGIGTNFAIHRLVAEAFCDNSNNYSEIDHRDGNKLNNLSSNLKWCSHKENMNNPNLIKNHKKSKKIVCENNNKIYDSISAASRELKIPVETIRRSIIHKNLVYNIWRFYESEL